MIGPNYGVFWLPQILSQEACIKQHQRTMNRTLEEFQYNGFSSPSSPSFNAVQITLGGQANKQPLSRHLYFSMIISVHGYIPTALSLTFDILIHKTRDLNLLT